MSEFKGTRGKWSYLDALGEVKSDTGGLVADMIVNGKEDENGRLIAAAPELLEALQVCAGYLGELDHNSAIYIALMDKINDAIEKALGQ